MTADKRIDLAHDPHQGRPPGNYVKCPVSLLVDPDLSPTEKCLLLLVAAHCIGDKQSCFPGSTRLANMFGLQERWVRALLKNLQHKGWLRIEPRPGRTSLYTLLPKFGPRKCTAGVPRNSNAGVERDPGTVLPDTPAVECRTPRNCTTDESEELNHKKGNSKDAARPRPQEKKSKRKDADARIRELIDHFSQCHESLFNAKYSVSGERDGQIFKTLLKDHSAETIKTCIDLFFKDDDEWLLGAEYSIPIFKSRFNRYLQRLTRSTTEPTSPAHRWL